MEKLTELGNESVHLTVTSPPYMNAKSYSGKDNDIGKNDNYNQYLDKIRIVIKELFRITKSGRVVCWNTSPIIDDGKRYGVPFDTHKIFIEEGFNFLEDIIWVKPSGAALLRCGGWCKNKGKPMTWYANNNSEYILTYRKPGKFEEKPYEKITKYYPEMPKDLLTNTWYMNPETQTTWHPAPFCSELAKRCIVLYSYPGDTVLDCFLGSGTVMKVARQLGRNSIGIELSGEYVEKAKVKIGFYEKSLFTNEVYELR